MENLGIISFYECSIDVSELSALPRDEAANFVAFLQIYDDLIVSTNQCLLSSNYESGSGDNHIDNITLVRRIYDNRRFSAIVFEAISAIESSGLMKDFSIENISSFRKIRKSRGYKIAKRIRNKMTNHFDVADVKGILERNRSAKKLNLYVSNRFGGTSYSEASLFVFNGILEFEFGRELTPDELAESWKIWFEWNFEAFKVCKEIIDDEILTKTISKLSAGFRHRYFHVPRDYVGAMDRSRPPLVLL